jgi:hypothetical protein
MNLPSEEVQVVFQDLDVTTDSTYAYGTANIANFVNVSRFHRWMALVFRTSGTGGIKGARVRVATAVAGTSATTLVSRDSTEATGLLTVSDGSNASGALGERGVGLIVFEGFTKDLDATLAGGDFLQVQLYADTATDEWGICWLLMNPRYRTSGLTTTGQGSTAA